MTPDPQLLSWLLTDARRLDSCGDVLRGIAERLLERGFPSWRLGFHLPQFHPQLWALGYMWRSDREGVEERRVPREVAGTQTYLHSPVGLMHRTGVTVRRRLSLPDEADFNVLEELREEGATDYLLVPLPMGHGLAGGFSLVTRGESGFSPEQVELIEALAPAVGAVCETFLEREKLEGLLRTYVGPEATRRILSGRVTLGAVQAIEAAVFFCDLRDFTAISERLNRHSLLALLNDYFDCMVSAVQATQGEVLKFLGDGMIAIFPLQDTETRDVAAARALSAAREAMAAIEDVNQTRLAAEQDLLRVGIALHIGTVLYGNIGAHDRLDFTAIGPTVNLASRIEAMCRELGIPILATAAFARDCPLPLRSLGRYAVRGLSEPQEVFTTADFAPQQPEPDVAAFSSL